jgi:hypothetical protein
MAKNEKTSKKMGTLASEALRGKKKLSKKQIQSLGGGLLTHRPDKKKKRG